MNPISSGASAASQQAIVALQAQMARYAPAASGQNSQAGADYKSLQSAIRSGNVSDAQAALARLQRDSRTAPAAASAPAQSAAGSSSPEGNDRGGAGGVQFGGGHTLDVTA